MKLKIKFLSLIFLFILIYSFLNSEQIDLSIKYLGIKVVKVRITDINNILEIRAKSTSIASIASKMDNLYLSEYSDNYLPLRYEKKINQKKYVEDRITLYNRENLTANRTSYIDPDKNCEYSIKSTSRDFFSALFYLRNTIDLNQGYMWIDANKIIWKAEYRILGNEILKTPLGKISTIKVEITCFKISPGSKERSDMLTNNLVDEEKSLFFWFTDDEKRIPVKAKFAMKPFPVVWKLEAYQE
ncbi:MAG: DUF3108 domain-containing protein [Candidatus Cloacimonetes bacterium]|nr:DUF3108 domain-containing protein [Candidatus Cloacimonadota bacterium]